MASTGCPTRVPRNLVAGRLRLRRSFADLLDVTALRDDGEGYAGYGHEDYEDGSYGGFGGYGGGYFGGYGGFGGYSFD